MATYIASAAGLYLTGIDVAGQVEWDGGTPGTLGKMGIALLFTVSHGIIPVFFYRAFMSRDGDANPVVGGFVTLHMGFWYGLPTVLLGALTGSLSLIVMVAHMILARRGTRRWVFLEYGSTSFCLLFFLLATAGERFFPSGLIVVGLQSMLLGLVGTVGKAMWTSAPDSNIASARSGGVVPQGASSAGDPDEFVRDRLKQLSEPFRSSAFPRALKVGSAVGLVLAVFFVLFGVFVFVMTQELLFLAFFAGGGLLLSLALGTTTFFSALHAPARASQGSWKDSFVGPYRELSERVNGQLKILPSQFRLIPDVPESVEFKFEQTDVRLDLETVGSDEDATQYVRLGFTLPVKTTIRFRVCSQGMLSDLATKLGSQDIQLGWPLFDDNFVVSANDRREASIVLTRNVQEGLLRLKQWLRERAYSDYLELVVEEAMVSIRLKQQLLTADDLMTYYELGREVYRELEPFFIPTRPNQQ